MSNGMRSCAQGVRGNNQFVTPLKKNNKWSLTPFTSPNSLLRHDYLIVSGSILSFQAGDNMVWSQGRIDRTGERTDRMCQMVCDDDKFDAYVFQAASEIGAPTYCISAYPGSIPHMLGARNCQTWANDVLALAKKKYLDNEKCPRCFK